MSIYILGKRTHMNNSENKVYYMERDGAVEIPEKYDKMNYAEITAECAILSKEKANKKSVTKKTKIPCKTKFMI